MQLEVWDEPTKHLSPQGVRDLLECLQQRAHSRQLPIWIIDHTSYAYGGFAQSVTIVKDHNGSRIEWDTCTKSES